MQGLAPLQNPLLGRLLTGSFQTATGEKWTIGYAAKAAKTEISIFEAASSFATVGRSFRFNDALNFQRYARVLPPRSLFQRL